MQAAIVNIEANKIGGQLSSSQGTGINLQPQGQIITNFHVVEGASVVEVTFSDGSRFFSRDIDPIEGYDLAIIKLQKGKNLPFLPERTDGRTGANCNYNWQPPVFSAFLLGVR